MSDPNDLMNKILLRNINTIPVEKKKKLLNDETFKIIMEAERMDDILNADYTKKEEI